MHASWNKRLECGNENDLQNIMTSQASLISKQLVHLIKNSQGKKSRY